MKRLQVYTDGSYDNVNKSCGWGYVIINEQENIDDELCGNVKEPSWIKHRNISGEIVAVVTAMNAIRESIAFDVDGYGELQEISIYYDLQGVRDWISPKNGKMWEANTDVTRWYQAQMKESMQDLAKKGISITWHKVKSHTGVKWNEYADALAKKGTKGGSYITIKNTTG